MEPICPRTLSAARPILIESQPDTGQPSADRGASTPADGPLDGLLARRTMSRTHLPASPVTLPACSEGSFGNLLHRVDLSFFEALPSFSSHHAEGAP